MATAVAHDVSATPAVLRPIESTGRWDDNGGVSPLTFNIVHVADADGAELTTFNNLLNDPTNAMAADLPAIWETTFAQIFQIFEEIIPLDLQLTTDVNANYLIGRSDDPNTFGAARSPRQFIDFALTQDIVFFNATAFQHTQAAEIGGGNDRFLTNIHEFGHTLGLSHPHGADDGSTSTGIAEDAQVAPYQWHHTIESYTPPPGVTVPVAPADTIQSSFGRSVTPMALDIASLQRLYDPNNTTRTGNSTYTLTDAGTAALDLTGDTISVGRAYYSIWDAGGTDTIQYTGNANVVINLNVATLANAPAADVTAQITELQIHAAFNTLSAATRGEITSSTANAGGFFSSVLTGTGDRIQGGYSIANGVVIERATGGGGNDVLIGNGAANSLTGAAGNDRLDGGGGADTLDGGTGNTF